MDVLHTSDWHLGATLYRRSRAADHDTVLGEIVHIAQDVKPDLILHTGDLFDHVRPSVDELTRAMTALTELACLAPVVVVCGNHDSPSLFGFLDSFGGRHRNIRFIDQPRAPEDGGILRFPGPDDTTARLAVLPFVYAHRTLDVFDDATHWRGAHAARIDRIQSELTSHLLQDLDPRRDVTLFATHQYVAGARDAGSERPAHTQDYYHTGLTSLSGVDYAAFGHIHRPQALPGSTVVGRYAGSPLPLDLGEEGERKSVSLVHLRPGQPAEVDELPLSGGRPVRHITATLDQLAALAPSVGEELCLVTVHTDTHQPRLADQITGLLPKAVLLDIIEVCADRTLPVLTRESTTAAAEPTLHELFRDYLSEHPTPSAPARQVAGTFDRLLAAVQAQQQASLPEEALLTLPDSADITTAPNDQASS